MLLGLKQHKLKLTKMDLTIGQNNKIKKEHFDWWGFENHNGALVRKNLEGEIQYSDGKYYYCKENKVIKELVIRKDLDEIVLPVANAEIAERNAKLN